MFSIVTEDFTNKQPQEKQKSMCIFKEQYERTRSGAPSSILKVNLASGVEGESVGEGVSL